MWPNFPFKCGDYALNNFVHAEKEVGKLTNLKLSTIPGRQYDPRKVAYDFSTSVSIDRFEHEPNMFDDLFFSVDKLSQVFDLAKSKFQVEEMNKFLLFRSQRLLKVPLDQLRVSIKENGSQQKETENTSSKTVTETPTSKIIIQTQK